MPSEYNGLAGLSIFFLVLSIWGLIAAKKERLEHEKRRRATSLPVGTRWASSLRARAIVRRRWRAVR